jgi:cell division protein FtsW (lipid II flippase)
LKNPAQNIDIGIMAPVMILSGIGLASIYSAGSARGLEDLIFRQALWFCIGLIIIAASGFYPMKNLLVISNGLYFALLILLLAVALFGSVKMGARRWIEIGPLQFQPSEIGKIFLICALARFYSQGKINWSDKKRYSEV